MSESYVRDRLAELVLGIGYADLPERTVHQAKRMVLDSMACLLGGYTSRPAKIVRQTLRELGGNPTATVYGSAERTSATHATLANGTAIRFLDWNDYYFRRDPSHASGNLAAALAVAESEGLDGKALLLGFVIGYEVQLRLVDHAGVPNLWERGWHHATNMAFSSAALSAHLMGLDALGTANAMAIAGSHNNTLTQSQRGNIPMMKATAEAAIAKGGVEAALLARAGLSGPEEAFEGKFGWIPVVAGEVDLDGLLAPHGGRFKIEDTCIKPYEAEMMTQSSVQAAIDVAREGRIDPDEVLHVEARFHDYAFRKPSWDPKKLQPKDKETADHSFPYCIAVAMIDGDCGPEQYTEERLADPRVRDLMAKVELTVDPALTALLPEKFGTAVKVTMRDGSVHESVCECPPGHPENPLSDVQIEAKFRRLAKGLLSPRQIDQAIAATWSLDSCYDMADYAASFVI
ncbi:MAG: MmgE/PrpD family protein [Acetobacterales bacterium]